MFKKIFYQISALIFLFFWLQNYVQAQAASPGNGTIGGNEFPNPIGANSFPEVFGLIIKGILGITGSLALVMFIYGGLTWMTAAGNGERVQKGKDVLIWATVGLAVIFGSYALIRFIFTALGIT